MKKKSNQEIIDAIVEASEHSFIRKSEQGTTNFCLQVNVDYEKETLKNFLSKAGLEGTHLGQLRRAKIVETYVIDDGALIMRFKDSFLTDEQRKDALEELEKSEERTRAYEREEAEKKHAKKCVAMHADFIDFAKGIGFMFSNEQNYPEGTIGARYRNKAQTLLKQTEEK